MVDCAYGYQEENKKEADEVEEGKREEETSQEARNEEAGSAEVREENVREEKGGPEKDCGEVQRKEQESDRAKDGKRAQQASSWKKRAPRGNGAVLA